ncbi:MAG TPA: ATP-binding cassette domain-containing protein [Candidatus Binatia bacterium]|nr:ATP-binding cassette domain-containing protein [Candidatus Binatia bacterium]
MSLVLDGLRKHFGTVVALDGLSFEVPKGALFGFLGSNGAGKTTTMRIVLGVLRADAGQVLWDGRSSTSLPRRTWGYLPEERGLYPKMTVLDQLVFFGRLHGLPEDRARREATAWLTRFRIADLAHRPAEELSKGNQQKVQLVAAILHDPPVLLLDEPFTGLDPVNVVLLREAILELRERGKTIVFSTHQLETVETLCEAVAIIDRGRLVVGGPIREVKRSIGRRTVRLGFEARRSDGAAGRGTIGGTAEGTAERTAEGTVSGAIEAAGDPAADGALEDGQHDRPFAWLAAVPGARLVRPGFDQIEIEVATDADADAVLAAAIAHGLRIRHFELTEASLEEVFIHHVGHPVDVEPGAEKANPEATDAPGRARDGRPADGLPPSGERPVRIP